LHVIDASREDLVADLSGSRALERTELHRVFVDESRGAGAPPWALIVGDGVFGPDPADAALLERLAAIAHRAGAPFIAGASPSIAGCPGFDASPEPETWTPGINAEWNAFRRSAGASWIGLVLPRFMLRLPYGHALDACESFTFEEMRTPPGHNDYLWGNGAFACAMMIAESFAESGWSMRPGTHQDLGGLPVHVYREHHEAVAKPCAESLMTERAAARLIEHGLMPLASIKDADRVRLVRFLSVASPECALSGRWQSQARA
jgi:type VI secretion system protein ImpC